MKLKENIIVLITKINCIVKKLQHICNPLKQINETNKYILWQAQAVYKNPHPIKTQYNFWTVPISSEYISPH